MKVYHQKITFEQDIGYLNKPKGKNAAGCL